MKRIYDEVDTLKGNVLCICVNDNKITKSLNKNKNVNFFEFSRSEKRKLFSKRKKVKLNNEKKVNIKKFRKVFKKKKIDYIIIDVNNIYDYFKYMAANSIYVCSKKVYLYGKSDFITASSVAKKFERYKAKVECIQDNDEYLVIANVKKTKYSRGKEILYLIIDTFINLGDMITFLLTS